MDVGLMSNLITELGFPICIVAACFYYINRTQQQHRDDNIRREDRLFEELAEMSVTNRTLLETNKLLATDIDAKLDKIIVNSEKKSS